EAIGAIAEMLGAVTVIASIFYLALQVKHANYVRWVLARMRVFENAHYQYRHGLLEEDEWTGYAGVIFGIAGPDSYAGRHWEWAAKTYSPSFVAEVERLGNVVASITKAPSQQLVVDIVTTER
ncbi:MAG: hypothetical protein KDI34_22300, partial [Halioglobus sp.]|nr:hypothetical protein [Halioglobus sp.]